jgi:hypothetical protein
MYLLCPYVVQKKIVIGPNRVIPIFSFGPKGPEVDYSQ